MKYINRSATLVILTTLILAIYAPNIFCAGKIITDQITSLALKDNKLGDRNIRDMVIYLPPDYDSSDKHYPVLYLLHGFGSSERFYVDSVTEEFIVFMLDTLIQSKIIKEMIIVMPDGSNKYGGSFFLNSELIGNYEDYIAIEIPNYIDKKYRTIRDRDACVIAGASMGGYGSVTLAMKHPEVYSAVTALSPPLAFEIMMKDIIPQVIKENPDGMMGPNSKRQYSDYIYALSAALSPNLNNPPFFVDLPFEYPSGNVIEPIKQKWLESDPLTMLKKDSSSLKRMKGIYIDVGNKDYLGFKDGADEFHKTLTELGINHEYVVFDGGHSDNGVERAINAITFLSKLLPDPSFPSTVYKNGKLTSTWGMIKRVISDQWEK
ncbi:MAG: alpha/beta hydrolase [Candidatus Poribacteria bacterium]